MKARGRSRQSARPPAPDLRSIDFRLEKEEPAFKQARTANERRAKAEVVKKDDIGLKAHVECMKGMTTMGKAWQAVRPLEPRLEQQGTQVGPAQPTLANAKPPIALEICCGHVGLALACCKMGFVAKGVDWQGNRHKPVIPIIRLDLTTPEGREEVHRILREENVRYVHAGPPCGTFSMALEKKIPKWLRKFGAPEPKPL